jgi:hypothetical protein
VGTLKGGYRLGSGIMTRPLHIDEILSFLIIKKRLSKLIALVSNPNSTSSSLQHLSTTSNYSPRSKRNLWRQ